MSTRLHHSLKQTMELSKFVQAHYPTTTKNDRDFAAHAAKELGFSVTYSQLARVRTALEIVPNKKPTKPDTIAGRIKALEAKVAELQSQVHVLLSK